VTHIHIDHYSLAVELRRTFHTMISLGEEERANLAAIRELMNGHRQPGQFLRLRQLASAGCAGA
jgi:glyoxylase-like metal-dependent hydrolase (beta-lactamase superfamily II)